MIEFIDEKNFKTESLSTSSKNENDTSHLFDVFLYRIGEKLEILNCSTKRFLKRFIDITLALALLVVLSPALLFLIALIPLSGGGPAVFTQLRWGRNCIPFRVLKFRTMHSACCDPVGTNQAWGNDPRITRLGRFLRKTNIDELPQLINVIKGEMSLVGPRCHPIGMHAGGMLFEHLDPHYHNRHTVRPGMTGLAQVRGLRGPAMDADKARARLASDRAYIRDMSPWLDLKIMLWTIRNEIRGGTGS